MSGVRLPEINARTFARSLVLRRGRREIANFLNRLGEENLRYLIENDKDISNYLSKEAEAILRNRAKSYKWAAELISEEDFYDIIPEWGRQIVESCGDKGKNWIKRQYNYLRRFFE